MRHAYSYIRFSSPEQALGQSLQRQTERSETLAARNGWVLDDTLSIRDLGVSAFKGKNWRRGGLATFLDAVKTGRVAKGSILIVESLDRFSRDDIDEALPLFMSLIKAGVDVATFDPERVYDRVAIKNPMHLMEPLFIFARANEESRMKSSRMQAAWQAKKKAAESGVVLSRMCPSWLQVVDGQYVAIPAAVATLRRIFSLAISGLGVIEIVRTLTREKIPLIARGKHSTVWQRSYVNKLLKNRALIGEYQRHVGSNARKPVGEPIQGYYPTIISEADFYRVQAGLASRATQRGKNGKEYANLFQNKIKCASGSVVVVKKGKGNLSMVSSAGVRGAEPYITFPYQLFEQGFFWVVNKLTPQELGGENNGSELEAAQAHLDDVQKRLAALAAKLEQSDLDGLDTLVSVIRKLEGEKKSAVKLVEELKAKSHRATNTQTLEDTRMLAAMAGKEGSELVEFRGKLKTKLRAMIERIDVTIAAPTPKSRTLTARVVWVGGGSTRFSLSAALVYGQGWHTTRVQEG